VSHFAERPIHELEYRVDKLALEIKEYSEIIPFGGGIYRRRLAVLKAMLDVLIQTKLKDGCAKLRELTDAGFAAKFLSVQRELAAVYDIWALFRNDLLLRGDERHRWLLDAANLTALQCYETISGLLNRPADRQTPPLIHLMASVFPMVVFGDVPAEHIGARILTTQRVPLPIVIVPFDHIHAMWMLVFMYHELGHIIDRESRFSAGFRERVGTLLPADRNARWKPWAEELIADAFGVILAGPAYGYALAELYQAAGPAFPRHYSYPPYWLRTQVVAQCIESFRRPAWSNDVAQIRRLALAPPPDDAALDCLKDVQTVAALVLDTVLGTNLPPLRALGRTEKDWLEIESLTQFFITGTKRPLSPDAKQCNIVFAAAALAAARTTGLDLSNLTLQAKIFIGDMKIATTYLSAVDTPKDFVVKLASTMVLT
jgi:hypothetical protein